MHMPMLCCSAHANAGTVFDVSHKRDTYGPGQSYNLFAGKDASRALGKSSLKEEDAISDYSELPENERKVLDDWHGFFTYVASLATSVSYSAACRKRYNIVGRVADLPPMKVSL
jgi:membrane-associated progesterone receptor component